MGEEGREDEGESPAQQVPLQEYVDPPPAHVTVAEVEAEQDGFPPSEPQEVDLPKGGRSFFSLILRSRSPAPQQLEVCTCTCIMQWNLFDRGILWCM